MNDYEARQEERRQRLERKAAELRAEAERRWSESDRLARVMNGQPILIGHHSERRHRRDIERMDTNHRKGSEAHSAAKEYERRAAAVGSGGIASEDPEAVAKLRAKLDKMIAERDRAKAINAHWRKHGSMAGFDGLSNAGQAQIDAKMASQTAPGASWVADPHKVFPGYYFQNLGANIRRVEQRIKELEAETERQERGETMAPIEGNGWRIEEHAEESRLWVVFDSKPQREVCQLMRRGGWKWSPQRGAWVRLLNATARWQAQELAGALKGVSTA